MKTLDDKVVVITGAGSGIGRALAARRRPPRRAARALRRRRGRPGRDRRPGQGAPARARCAATGSTSPTAPRSTAYAAAVAEQFGRVNVVVNNAGVALAGDVEDLDLRRHRLDHRRQLLGRRPRHQGVPAAPDRLRRRPRRQPVVALRPDLDAGPVDVQRRRSTPSAASPRRCARRCSIAGHPVGVTAVHPGGIKTAIARNGRYSGREDARRDRAALRREAGQDDARAGRRDHRDKGILGSQARVLVGLDAHALHHFARLTGSRYQDVVAAVAKRTEAAPTLTGQDRRVAFELGDPVRDRDDQVGRPAALAHPRRAGSAATSTATGSASPPAPRWSRPGVDVRSRGRPGRAGARRPAPDAERGCARHLPRARRRRVSVYVDIDHPAGLGRRRCVRAVDLDLDVIRMRDGRWCRRRGRVRRAPGRASATRPRSSRWPRPAATGCTPRSSPSDAPYDGSHERWLRRSGPTSPHEAEQPLRQRPRRPACAAGEIAEPPGHSSSGTHVRPVLEPVRLEPVAHPLRGVGVPWVGSRAEAVAPRSTPPCHPAPTIDGQARRSSSPRRRRRRSRAPRPASARRPAAGRRTSRARRRHRSAPRGAPRLVGGPPRRARRDPGRARPDRRPTSRSESRRAPAPCRGIAGAQVEQPHRFGQRSPSSELQARSHLHRAVRDTGEAGRRSRGASALPVHPARCSGHRGVASLRLHHLQAYAEQPHRRGRARPGRAARPRRRPARPGRSSAPAASGDRLTVMNGR